eukprot:gene7612-8452_t
MEDKLPVKLLSTLGDCGQNATFKMTSFLDGLKDYITRQEQAQASNSNRSASPKPSFGYEAYEYPSMSTMIASAQVRCQLCKGPHTAQRCSQTATDKTTSIINQKLCLNCLYPGHRAAQCSVRGRCAKCKGKHHTAIHGIQIHRNNDANSNAFPSRNSNQHRQPRSQTHSRVAVVSNQSAPPSSNQDSPTLQYTATNCASIAPPSVLLRPMSIILLS